MQSDVNVPVAFHGIGSICDEVLVESVKAVVVEYCCQPFSLIVKCAYSELSWFLFWYVSDAAAPKSPEVLVPSGWKDIVFGL